MVLDLVEAGVAGGHSFPAGVLRDGFPQVLEGVGNITSLSVALRV